MCVCELKVGIVLCNSVTVIYFYLKLGEKKNINMKKKEEAENKYSHNNFCGTPFDLRVENKIIIRNRTLHNVKLNS